MTQKQAEENWGWDAKRGSIPFKRPRITPKNIRAQRKLARPGTLIHWAGKPCSRGRAKTDEQLTDHNGDGHGTVRLLAIASHIANVNCLECRRRYFAR
jgi:hypothetical protein